MAAFGWGRGVVLASGWCVPLHKPKQGGSADYDAWRAPSSCVAALRRARGARVAMHIFRVVGYVNVSQWCRLCRVSCGNLAGGPRLLRPGQRLQAKRDPTESPVPRPVARVHGTRAVIEPTVLVLYSSRPTDDCVYIPVMCVLCGRARLTSHSQSRSKPTRRAKATTTGMHGLSHGCSPHTSSRNAITQDWNSKTRGPPPKSHLALSLTSNLL
jgi:hypothetical protein